MTSQGWIKQNRRHSLMSCAIFRTRVRATGGLRGLKVRAHLGGYSDSTDGKKSNVAVLCQVDTTCGSLHK